MSQKPLDPVKPVGMEIVFLYPCPFCAHHVPLLSPTRPAMGRCDACQRQFPVVPVDEKNIRFLKTIMAGGRSGVDPDFL